MTTTNETAAIESLGTRTLLRPALGAIEEKLERVNRRATRLGREPLRLAILGEERRHTGRDAWGHPVWKTFLTVAIEGEAPRLPGYRFLGTIQNTAAGALVRTIPGAPELPESVRVDSARCDHCGTNRRRRDTFAVEEVSTGAVLVVGRSCLQDFVGLDPESVLWAWYASGALFEEFDGASGESMRQEEEALRFLAHAAWISRVEGYVSGARARDEGIASTANGAAWLLFPPIGSSDAAKKERAKISAWKEKHPAEESDHERARVALEWARGASGNDFLENLSVVASLEVWTAREWSYGASILAAHAKATEQELAEKARRAAWSAEYAAPVGTRTEFRCTVERRVAIEGNYGTRHVVTLRDDSNRCLVWFASRFEVPEGEAILLRATVKEHGEFRGVLQTVLTRGSVLERDATAAAERKL